MYFTTRHIVKDCLEQKEYLRDNDNLLISEVIQRIEGNDLETLSAKDLLKNIQKGKYGAFEAITRARRKHQEVIETLRGEKWIDRRAYCGHVVQQLTFWDLLDGADEHV